MAKTAKQENTDKPKRAVLSDDERIAKLEAQLAATRERAERKANKAAIKAAERKAVLVERRDKIQAEIDELDAIIGTPVDEAQRLAEEGKD